MTTKEKVLALLISRRSWIPSYDLEKVSTSNGWIGTSGGRRARDLRAEGLIESKPCKDIRGMKVDGNVVCFRVKRAVN